MAKRKKKKLVAFSFDLSGKKKKKQKNAQHEINVASVLKVMAVVVIFVAIALGFIIVIQYNNKVDPISQRPGFLQFIETPPSWVTEQIKTNILKAARSGGEDLKLDEAAAQSVQHNISVGTAWLYDVRVRTTSDRFLIDAKWRKPLALMKLGLKKCYLDGNMVSLEAVEIPQLPIVKIAGMPLNTKVPSPGGVCDSEDVMAAMEVIKILSRMDERLTPEKPLLRQIDRIDISNYKGQKRKKASHIILYTTNNTEILWGAEVGAWSQYLEATDEEKVARLYSFYSEHGSLLNGVKYIDLSDLQQNIPQPIDGY